MVGNETTATKASCGDTEPRQRERRLPVTLFRIFLWFFFKLFYRSRWRYFERVPKTGPVILAPSHASFYDPPFVNVPVWRRCHFFTRDKYFKPLLGRIIRYLGAFPVDLDRRFDAKAYDQARQVLEDGGMLILFPEGTRSWDGRLGKIYGGVAALALETGATIVPVSVCGAFEAWPRTRKYPRFCRRMWAVYHRPIPVEKTKDPTVRRQKTAEISSQIERLLARRLRGWEQLLRKHNLHTVERTSNSNPET